MPRVVWTGERHLFAHARRGQLLDFEVADGEGRSIRNTEVMMDAFPLSSFPFDGTRATFGAVAGVDANGASHALHLVELDVAGVVAGDVVTPWPTSDVQWGQLVEILSSPSGPLVLVAGAYPPASPMQPSMPAGIGLHRFDRASRTLVFVARLPFGELVMDLAVTRRLRDELIIAVEGGDQLEIFRIRESGEILDQWMLPGGDGNRSGFELYTHGQRIFLSYVRELSYADETVEVQQLGCTP